MRHIAYENYGQDRFDRERKSKRLRLIGTVAKTNLEPLPTLAGKEQTTFVKRFTAMEIRSKINA